MNQSKANLPVVEDILIVCFPDGRNMEVSTISQPAEVKNETEAEFLPNY